MCKVVYQTFWSKPLIEKKRLAIALDIAYISLYYAHKSGYTVHMYTDSIGIGYLKEYGYDYIESLIDNIPNNISTKQFAYPKIMAMEKEPLGTIHVDFDVFLKQNCLDKFFNDNTIDCILQCEELNMMHEYQKSKKCLLDIDIDGVWKDVLEHDIPSNVGIIGFNNQEFKDEYISRYKDMSDFFHYDKSIGMPDLYFEQININQLSKIRDYNVYYLLGAIDYSDPKQCKLTENNDLEYIHIQGQNKWNKISELNILNARKKLEKLNKYV